MVTHMKKWATDTSFKEATRFASEAKVDGYISLGGGSVIDTAKAANLYATHPAEFLAYVNAPIGEARPIPGPLKHGSTVKGVFDQGKVRVFAGRVDHQPQPVVR